MKLYKIYLDHGHAHVTNDTNLVRVRTRNWKSIIMRCGDLLQKKCCYLCYCQPQVVLILK